MECKKLNIAIDGPAGAGKSTVARRVANSLGYTYFDTGAMYRALAVLAMERNVSLDDFESLGALASEVKIEGREDNGVFRVWIDGKEITDKLREPETDRAVALLSKATPVRKVLVSMQQQIAKCGGVVMEGRDITSVVMPDAEVKVFLTADVNERARRRWQEQVNKGIDVSFEDVLDDLVKRDAIDLEREWGKLIKVDDAEVIDSTDLSIEEVCALIINLCKEKQKCSTRL
ncbi:MAG: (d)CMP kinase [Firmicutes bacterium]|nr:(d)CMP kinase [Candidatus Fermentithermobacillaceae bacterium]